MAAMKTHILFPIGWRRLLVVALVVASSAASVCFAQAPGAMPRLHFATGLVKSRILVGEPLFVYVYATNASKYPVTLSFPMRWSSGAEATIAWPDRAPLQYVGLSERTKTPQAGYRLDPSETRETRVIDHSICYKLADEHSDEGFVFDRPGRATVQLKLFYKVIDAPQVLEPRPFAVEVVAPEREADRAALEAIKADRGLAICLQSGVASPSYFEIVEAFVERFPDSTYTPYLRFALVGGLTFSKSDEPLEFEAWLKRGVEAARAFRRDYPDFYQLDEVMYRQAYCHDKLGQAREAMDRIMEIMRGFPECWRLSVSDPLLRRYVLPEETIATAPWSLCGRFRAKE